MGEGFVDPRVYEQFFGYQKREDGKEKQPVESGEKIEKFEECARKVQELSGVSSFVDDIHVTQDSWRGPEAPEPIEGWSRDRAQGFMNIPETSSGFSLPHEMAHQVLWGEVENIQPYRVKHAVTEGLCDLIAIEVFCFDQGEDVLKALVSDFAEHYRRNVSEDDAERFRQSESPGEEVHRDWRESLGHAMGRRFCFSVRNRFPEEPLSSVVYQVLKFPPTEDEIVDPDLYMRKIGKLEVPEAAPIKRVRISFDRPRLI